MTNLSFRLPTEAEWEFAAKGGNKSCGYKYSGSYDIGSVAWYGRNAYNVKPLGPDYGTHYVGKKRPNELGLYDMSGNVWEWCQDWHKDYSRKRQKRIQKGHLQDVQRLFVEGVSKVARVYVLLPVGSGCGQKRTILSG